MPAATSKSDLMIATTKEFARLSAVLDRVADDQATHPDTDGWSIRDVIIHRAHWIDLFLGWVADGQAGREVHIPAKGVKWNALKPYNATVRDRNADVSWAEARSRLSDKHAALLKLMEEMPEDALYDCPMPGQDKWTTGRYAEASGASHYRSAAKFVRARLRALSG
ncbi:MAG: ClbS/DfsB family four-helix bundle protein [Pseudomonadota bacterium]